MSTMYQNIIKDLFPDEDVDPRHVEGYLRLRFGTLDHLSRDDLEEECLSAMDAIDMDPKAAEQLAQSYGL